MTMVSLHVKEIGARELWPVGAMAAGIMVRSPSHGQAYRAELGVMPLYEAREFMNAVDFENDSTAPVLLSPTQRYALLADLVYAARHEIVDLSTIVVRLCGADFMIQLPSELLGEDVILTHDPDKMLPMLARSGREGVLLLWQSLRTDGYEVGTNEIRLTILGARSTPSFFEFVRNNEVLSSLEDLEVVSWHETNDRRLAAPRLGLEG